MLSPVALVWLRSSDGRERWSTKPEVVGSSPTGVACAGEAQPDVRLPCKQEVVGSNPTAGSLLPRWSRRL